MSAQAAPNLRLRCGAQNMPENREELRLGSCPRRCGRFPSNPHRLLCWHTEPPTRFYIEAEPDWSCLQTMQIAESARAKLGQLRARFCPPGSRVCPDRPMNLDHESRRVCKAALLRVRSRLIAATLSHEYFWPRIPCCEASS